MSKFGNMTITTYNSLLTGKRTVINASIGKCGHDGYKEAQIRWNGTNFTYIITDGYNYLSIERTLGTNLKSALNIIEGNLK